MSTDCAQLAHCFCSSGKTIARPGYGHFEGSTFIPAFKPKDTQRRRRILTKEEAFKLEGSNVGHCVRPEEIYHSDDWICSDALKDTALLDQLPEK